MKFNRSDDSLQKMLIETLIHTPNGDMIITTISGQKHTVFEPVTVFKDFIRFSNKFQGQGDLRQTEVPFHAIDSANHK